MTYSNGLKSVVSNCGKLAQPLTVSTHNLPNFTGQKKLGDFSC